MTSEITDQTRRPTIPVKHWHLAPAHAASGIGDGTGPVAAVPGKRVRPFGELSTTLDFVLHQGDVLFTGFRGGDVVEAALRGGPGPVVIVCRPDHIKSIMTADESIAPSATDESPLRPIVGGQSVLTSIGERHRQQRALLLPRFHGKAVANYQEAIDRATDSALSTWPVGKPVRLADIAQQITLDVIMSAIFGLPAPEHATRAERSMRAELLRLLRLSTTPFAVLTQLINARRAEPVGVLRLVLARIDRRIFAVIAERRASAGSQERSDILELLLSAKTEDGKPLSDREIRDELMTMLLAGHETTANTVGWTFERLTRNSAVYRHARDAAKANDDEYLEALINESFRSRPVVPVVARHLLQPWTFDDVQIPAGQTALVSILALHHRDDLYPKPFDFDPSRFLGGRPKPHELMPFGGGIRRCLGAPLAMAELRTVTGEILRRVELETTAAPAERPRHRNVTMIPGDGGSVTARAIR